MITHFCKDARSLISCCIIRLYYAIINIILRVGFDYFKKYVFISGYRSRKHGTVLERYPLISGYRSRKEGSEKGFLY